MYKERQPASQGKPEIQKYDKKSRRLRARIIGTAALVPLLFAAVPSKAQGTQLERPGHSLQIGKTPSHEYPFALQETPHLYHSKVGFFADPSFKTHTLKYSLRAVEQKNVYMAAYEINGKTNTGRWFQTGIAYASTEPLQSQTNPGPHDRFSLVYEIWDRKNSIYPSKGGSERVSFNGIVHAGDKIEVTLKISRGGGHPASQTIVTMTAEDLYTAAVAEARFSLPKEAGEVFTGGKNRNGYITGPMTELVTEKPISGAIEPQEYVNIYPKMPDETVTEFQETALVVRGSGWQPVTVWEKQYQNKMAIPPAEKSDQLHFDVPGASRIYYPNGTNIFITRAIRQNGK